MTLYLKKFLKILVIVLLIFIVFNNIALAGKSNITISDTFNGTITGDKAKNSSTKIQDLLLEILTAVRIAGMAIALIILVVIGIKIMMASPSEKANIKQYSMNYVIGAFILIGATTILTIVQNVAKSSF